MTQQDKSAQGNAYLISQGSAESAPTLAQRLFDRYRPRPLAYRRLLRTRVRSWLVGLNAELMRSATWMGVPAAKNPLDAWVYQEIVCETRPEVIVELGSAYGGGALFFAHLMDLLGGEGAVISVDVSRDVFQAQHERIIEITGSTDDPGVVEQVRARCKGKRTMIIHDASHRAAQVYEDLRTYSPLVSPGCYFIVEDGMTDVMPPRFLGGYPGPGPYYATKAFLEGSAPFDVDPTRERFSATNNPCGFLRRRLD